MQIDDTDRRILRQLLADPGLATAELAERAGVTAATCWRRLERLAEAGIRSVAIETDLGEHLPHQTITRIEAFLETLS